MDLLFEFTEHTFNLKTVGIGLDYKDRICPREDLRKDILLPVLFHTS